MKIYMYFSFIHIFNGPCLVRWPELSHIQVGVLFYSQEILFYLS